jgi:hypothetical protein
MFNIESRVSFRRISYLWNSMSWIMYCFKKIGLTQGFSDNLVVHGLTLPTTAFGSERNHQWLRMRRPAALFSTFHASTKFKSHSLNIRSPGPRSLHLACRFKLSSFLCFLRLLVLQLCIILCQYTSWTVVSVWCQALPAEFKVRNLNHGRRRGWRSG